MANRNPSLAEEWRAKLAEKRRGAAVPLLLPCGVTVMVARPPIETWFGTAKLPERLSRNVVEVFNVDIQDPDAVDKMEATINGLSDEENAEVVLFMNRLLLEGVVEPEVVDVPRNELKDGQMALGDIGEEDRAFILFMIMQGVPAQPVPTASGEGVSVEALGRFRHERGGPAPGQAGGEVPHGAGGAGGPAVPG